MQVLIGIDGSAHALAALELAGHLLDPLQDTIVLYFSVPTAELDALQPESRDVFERARDALGDSVIEDARSHLPESLRGRCTTVTGKQKASKGLVAAAQQQKADLVVVGARGQGPIKRLLLGSVSRSVVHGVDAPVLVVRTSDPQSRDRPLRVLFCCDASDVSHEAAAFLGQLTWPAGSEGTVIHVTESMFVGPLPDWLLVEAQASEYELHAKAWALEHEQQLALAREEMRNRCAGLPAIFHDREPIIEEGHPGEKILERLESNAFDLVVVGTKRLGAVSRFLLGSTSEHVLAHAPCSVLLVPHHAAP